jgi:pimeloyl-ACP methyl ester carboxylesterase
MRWIATSPALPDVTFLELENAGHCPQLEEPERITRKILAFTD